MTATSPRPSAPRLPLPSVRRAAAVAIVLCALAASALPVSAARAPRTTAGGASTAPAAPLAAGAVAHRLSADVVGYLPWWEVSDATLADLDLSKLSSIVLFSVGWDAGGHLVTDDPGYSAATSARVASVVSAAHAAGDRVLISFTSFGSAKNAAFFSSSTARATFVKEAAAFVKARGLDGADLDVELISGTYFDSYAATAASLRAALRAANPNALLTVATNGNTSGAKMAAKAIAAGADRAFIMGYSYRTAGSTPGSIDPLASSSSLSLSRSLDLYATYGAPLSRVVLGLPLYGRTWPTVDATAGSASRTDLAGGTFTYRALPDMLKTGTLLSTTANATEQSTRLVRSIDGVFWQSFYDSPANFRAKLGLVVSRHLAGAGLWALGYANGMPDYWTAIGTVFSPPAITALRVTPSPTNRASVSVGIGWRNGAAAATQVRLANGSGTFSAWKPLSAAVSWTLPSGTSVATRTVRAQVRDANGALSAVSAVRVLYDPVRPRETKLTMAWSSTARAWVVRYYGTDVGSGVAGYKIVVKRNGIYTTLAARRPSPVYVLRLPHSAHFLVAVRTVDRAGNLSAARFISH